MSNGWHAVTPRITDPDLLQPGPFAGGDPPGVEPFRARGSFFQEHRLAIAIAVVVLLIALVVVYVYLTRKEAARKKGQGSGAARPSAAATPPPPGEPELDLQELQALRERHRRPAAGPAPNGRAPAPAGGHAPLGGDAEPAAGEQLPEGDAPPSSGAAAAPRAAARPPPAGVRFARNDGQGYDAGARLPSVTEESGWDAAPAADDGPAFGRAGWGAAPAEVGGPAPGRPEKGGAPPAPGRAFVPQVTAAQLLPGGAPAPAAEFGAGGLPAAGRGGGDAELESMMKEMV